MFTNVISHGGGVLSILLSALCLISCTKQESLDPLEGGRIRFKISVADLAPTKASSQDSAQKEAEFQQESVIPLTDASGAETLYLHASVSESWGDGSSTPLTKGAVATATNFHQSIGCFGYYATSDELDNADSVSISPRNFSDIKVTEQSGWVMENNQTWYTLPGGETLYQWICAYAPYKDEISGLTVTPTGGWIWPHFDYVVPNAIVQQKDFMVSMPTDPTPDDPYPLLFQHVLAGVRFVTKDIEQGSISKISLKGVYGAGSWDFNNNHYDKVKDANDNTIYSVESNWTTSGVTKDFSYEFPTAVNVTGNYGQMIVNDDCAFMMIPQVLPQGASIEVEFTAADGTAKTLSANIGGTLWGMGHMHSYFISYNASGAHLVVTPMEEFSHDGESKDFTLSSYTRANGASTPAPWTAQFVNKNPDGSFSPATSTPSWVHLQDANGSDLTSLAGSGSSSAETFKVSVDASTSVPGNPHNDALSQATQKGSAASPWNLSSASGSLSSASDVQNTANCYIINAPGTYCLPLVYGNAIKNGQDNTGAYSTTVVDHSGENPDYDEDEKTYILSTFKNHLDADITAPWIDDNDGCTSASATLVWQDEQDLVSVESTLKTVDNKKFLVFSVPSSSIKQGNAIIAVRDEQNTIMWSWHIWVTDYVPNLAPDVDNPMRDKVVQNHSEQHDRYTMMPLNLGWTDNYTESYPERIAYIQFTQTGTNRTDILEVKQRAYTGTSWSNTYYQWGRKDPMLGATLDSNSAGYYENGVDKTSYFTDQSLDFKKETGNKSLGAAISAPNVFILNPDYHYDSDWCSTHYSNLWDADFAMGQESIEYDNIKTIYDPSPVGYKVAPYHAYEGFVFVGDDWSGYIGSHTINTPYTSQSDFTANYGWEFYCNAMHGIGQFDDKGGTIFFPASGYRGYDSGVGYDLGSGGYFWSAAAYVSCSGYCLNFDSYCVNPRDVDDRTHGNSVRPVQE